MTSASDGRPAPARDTLRRHHRARRSLPGRKAFREPDGKTQANELLRRQRRLRRQCGGRDCAARRPRGRSPARSADPPDEDANGDRVLAALAHELVDCSGCERIAGVSTALSAIFIDARGDRMIVTWRDERHRGRDAAPIPAGSWRRPTRYSPTTATRLSSGRSASRRAERGIHRRARCRPADRNVRGPAPNRLACHFFE